MTAVDATGSPVGAELAAVFTPISAPRAAVERPATTVSPRVQPALERRRLWERRYSRRLRVTDSVIVVGATAATALVGYVVTGGADAPTTAQVAAITAIAWILTLWFGRTRATSIIGSGPTEYKRVAHATAFAFGILAMLFVGFQLPGIRLQLLATLPAGLLALLVSRWLWRKWLVKQRAFGHYSSRALVAGTRADVEYVISTLRGGSMSGYTVVGVATSQTGDDAVFIDDRSYPVVSTMESVAMRARQFGIDTVIVASRPDDDPDYIKRLSWELEGTASELILSSRLTDVAGPRISLRPIDGLPLIHVKIPEFEGATHGFKRVLDVVFASLALIPIALCAPFIALAIKLDSKGPVLFRQTRIGRDGHEFGMLKFRTMRVNAEAELAALQTQNDGSGPLFKMKRDPRITRVGAVLRRFSLDELPQFVNVLVGHMSVVGPRPPLPREVKAYDGTVYRRLYIKPGITGLWQITGRSDLSWDESVRLDLRYVENWSVMSDLMIMWRTLAVMIKPVGAY